jgi:hypothetical protein
VQADEAKHPADDEENWPRYPMKPVFWLINHAPEQDEDGLLPKVVKKQYVCVDLPYMYDYREWMINTFPERAQWRAKGAMMGLRKGKLQYTPYDDNARKAGGKPIYPKEGQWALKPTIQIKKNKKGKWVAEHIPWINKDLTWEHKGGYTKKEEEEYKEKEKVRPARAKRVRRRSSGCSATNDRLQHGRDERAGAPTTSFSCGELEEQLAAAAQRTTDSNTGGTSERARQQLLFLAASSKKN